MKDWQGVDEAVEMVLRDNEIEQLLQGRDLDIRKSHDARWIDQKCTPDVVSLVADCIVHYVEDACHAMTANGRAAEQELHDYSLIEFSAMDVLRSCYATNLVQAVFKKPNPEKLLAKSEYSKFFMQPMEMLAYAGVLSKRKMGRSNKYSVADMRLLEYIAFRDRNALLFMQHYIKKVLSDSGLMDCFAEFFDKQTPWVYRELKRTFSTFIKEHTPINGDMECNRIFVKVLNPLAFAHKAKGTERGHLSAHIITYDMLMYNRTNFRDKLSGKAKDCTRKECAPFIEGHQAADSMEDEAVIRNRAQKARNFLRRFNKKYLNGKTECHQIHHMQDDASFIHHIFPVSTRPEISFYLENMIALTPTQHLNYAYPDGITQGHDLSYQQELLMAKVERIRENLEQSDPSTPKIYSFWKLVHVIAVGFDNPKLMDEIPNLDWDALALAIKQHYGE